MDNEFEYQKRAYNSYVKYFTPELLWTNTIYKDLYNGLTDSLEVAKASLGDYYFEQYVKDINENLNRIENEVNTYIQNSNLDKIQKENIFYHKPLLENRIDELIKEHNSTETTKPIDKNIMFQLGVRLAIGDLDNYYTVNKNKKTFINHGYSAPQISKELGNPEWNKFILATLNYYQTGQNQTKNIWINKKTMRQVYTDCKDEKNKMTDFFIEKYNELLQD